MELIQYELDNGMNVLLAPSAAAPVVACNVWVGVGSADETRAEAGLAHVHEHMLFKGTERRGVGQIAREVEAAGGHINAFTSLDQTCYYVVLSSRFLERGLDILSDAIAHSAFDADELGRELEVIQEELKRGEDSPSRMATLKLFETSFTEHTYRFPIIGTKESIDSLVPVMGKR
ncbi:MAG: pitrilysin family protein [Myxococcota bacterium]